jgi:aromatic ring-opening dioxygenase catalytic subunit (LigB family)
MGAHCARVASFSFSTNPLLYVLGMQDERDEVQCLAEKATLGSMSMRSVRK